MTTRSGFSLLAVPALLLMLHSPLSMAMGDNDSDKRRLTAPKVRSMTVTLKVVCLRRPAS